MKLKDIESVSSTTPGELGRANQPCSQCFKMILKEQDYLMVLTKEHDTYHFCSSKCFKKYKNFITY